MSVTIKDIAEKAKISYPSVSRALSGKPGVSEKTRKKVLKIAREMNYQPNALARGLVQNRTSSLGLIIPDIINPYFPEIARAVDEEAHKRGYSVFLCNSRWDEEREGEYVTQLLEKRVDGFVVFPSSDKSLKAIREKTGSPFPMIVLGADYRGEGTAAVSIDDAMGGELATEHLLSRGYRSLAFIGGEKGRSGVERRLDGFRRAHKKFGVPVEETLIVNSGFEFDSGFAALRSLLDSGNKPDAVFAENDIIALGVMQAARSAGLSIPGDLAIIGFDDIPMASFLGVELTTVRQPKYEMGKIAVMELIALLENDDEAIAARKVILEPELIIRKTT